MRIAAFFRDESCGQCVPCRVGTVRQQEALARLIAGRPRATSATSSRSSPRSASACATRRSAASARRRRAPSSRRSGGSASSGTVADVVRELDMPARMVELEIDGQAVRVFEGSTILDACTALGIDTPTLCFGETLRPANVCRVCVVELEGPARARAGVLAQGRAGMVVKTDSSASASPASWCSSCSPPRSTFVHRRAPRLPRALRRAARALRPAGTAGPDRDRQAHRAPRRAGRADRGDGLCPDEGRQRALRPRLLEVHPLLQVRRRLRRAVPEHVRDRRRRTRLRRPHLDRVRHRAPRVGVRLLRQLHRRLPDRRADLQERVRPARRRDLGRVRADPDRHDLPLLRRGLQPHAAHPGQRDRQGHLAGRPRHHPREPLHQGTLRLPARPGARQLTSEVAWRPARAGDPPPDGACGDHGGRRRARRPRRDRLATEEPLEIRAPGPARSR